MTEKKQIFIGTANPSKLPYLCGFFDENAIEKAASWHRIAKMPVFALDAGLLFLDLPDNDPDQPGVHVRRAAGHSMNDEEMLMWFAGVAHRHGGRLRAAWQDSYCIMRTPGAFRTFTFTRQMLEPNAFIITDTPCAGRLDGWPLNSISVDIPTGKYWLEMTDSDRARSKAANAEKNEFVHELRQWVRRTAGELLGEA